MTRRFTSLFTITTFILAATAAAFAADMAVKAPAPVPAPIYSWTGFYTGINAGYGWQDPTANFSLTTTAFNLASFLGPGPPVSFNMSGPLGGFQAGYNWQVQNWVVGFETDFDFSNIKGGGTSPYTIPGPGTTFPLASSANEKVDWFGTVRGRLGFLPASNVLVYGTGGFAYGRVQQNTSLINGSGASFTIVTTTCPSGPIVCFAGTSARVATGWTLGGGLEYAFWNHWTLRAEYLFVNLGGNTFNENDLSGTNSIAARFSATTFNVARGGLNYRF